MHLKYKILQIYQCNKTYYLLFLKLELKLNCYQNIYHCLFKLIFDRSSGFFRLKNINADSSH